MSNLLIRCCQAYGDGATGRTTPRLASPAGMHSALFHLASELNSAGHREAARWLMEQLSPKVVALRPPGPGGAA